MVKFTIIYNVAGNGQSLLLVHGINAGASNYEWRKNFAQLARYFKVFALDLPGFARFDRLWKRFCVNGFTSEIFWLYWSRRLLSRRIGYCWRATREPGKILLGVVEREPSYSAMALKGIFAA